MRGAVIALAALLLLSCTGQVTRDRWQQMNGIDKTLYVRSMLGAERAKDAKGGGGHHYGGKAENYVKRIDEAYGRGDRRDPAAIFGEMADHR